MRPLAILAVAACSGGGSQPTPLTHAGAVSFNSGTTNSPIQHIVLVIQENRTFNNLFATFPGATGATTGLATFGTGPHRHTQREDAALPHLAPQHHVAAMLP